MKTHLPTGLRRALLAAMLSPLGLAAAHADLIVHSHQTQTINSSGDASNASYTAQGGTINITAPYVTGLQGLITTTETINEGTVQDPIYRTYAGTITVSNNSNTSARYVDSSSYLNVSGNNTVLNVADNAILGTSSVTNVTAGSSLNVGGILTSQNDLNITGANVDADNANLAAGSDTVLNGGSLDVDKVLNSNGRLDATNSSITADRLNATGNTDLTNTTANVDHDATLGAGSVTTIDTNSTLNVTGKLTAQGTLNVTDSHVNAGNADLAAGSATTMNNGTLKVDDLLSSSGTLDATNSSITAGRLNATGKTDLTNTTANVDHDATLGAGSVTTIDTNSTLNVTGKLTAQGTLNVTDSHVNAGNADLAAGSTTTMSNSTLVVDNILNSNGTLTVTNGNVNAGQLNVTGATDITGQLVVTESTKVTNGGDLTLNATVPGSELGKVTVEGEGSSLNISSDNDAQVDLDSMTVRNSGTADVSGTTLHVGGGNGTITVDDGWLDIDNGSHVNGNISVVNKPGHVDIRESVVNGDVSIAAGDSILHMDDATINGDLTISGAGTEASSNGNTSVGLTPDDTLTINKGAELNVESGTLTSEGDIVINTNGTLNIGEGGNIPERAVETNATVDAAITILDGTVNVHSDGAIVGSVNFDGRADGDRTVNFLDDNERDVEHSLSELIVNQDGTINVEGDLTIDKLVGDSAATLTLNGNEDNYGTIRITGEHNAGFSSDINMGNGTIEIAAANEALGKEGTLYATEGWTTTLLNTAQDAIVSKDISTATGGYDGNMLTVNTQEDLTLAGTITMDYWDDFEKEGHGVLTLNNKEGMSVLGNVRHREGFLVINGKYDFARISTEENSILIIHESDIAGDYISSESNTLITQSLVDADLYVRNGETFIGDKTEVTGDVVINGTLTIIGQDVSLATGTSRFEDADSCIFFEQRSYGNEGIPTLNIRENFVAQSDIVFQYTMVPGFLDIATPMAEEDEEIVGIINVDPSKSMLAQGQLVGEETALLVKEGEGLLTLASDNTETWFGNSILAEGILQGTANNAFGGESTTLVVVNDTTLVTGGSDSRAAGLSFDNTFDFSPLEEGETTDVLTLAETNWTGEIIGTEGTINKYGDAKLRLTDATSNPYFDTDINVVEGGLVLNRALGNSNITLDQGTSLSGYGSTRGDVTAIGHGTSIAVGEDGAGYVEGQHTLTMNNLALIGGDVTVQLDNKKQANPQAVTTTGTTTKVDISLGQPGTGEKLVVNGDVKLNNSLLQIENVHDAAGEAGIADGTRYTVLELGRDENGNMIGSHDANDTFHHEVLHNFDLLNARTENTATGVDVVLSINHKGAQKTFNQQQASFAIDAIDKIESAVGALAELIHEFGHTQSEQEAKEALNWADGVCLTTTMSGMISGNQNHLRAIRGAMGNGTPITPSCSGKKDIPSTLNQNFWSQATNSYNKVNGDGNAPGYSRDAWGAAVGYGWAINSEWMVGTAFSYDYSRLTTDYSLGKTDAYYIDLYAQYKKGNWTNKAIVGVGIYDFTLDRSVHVAGFNRRANGSTDGLALNLGYELAYTFHIAKSHVIEPLFVVESSVSEISGYTESGNIDNAGLVVSRQDAWATTLGLGARYNYDFACFNCAPRANVFFTAMMTAEVGDLNDRTEVRFKGAVDHPYRMNPATRDRVGLYIGSGLSIPFTNSWAGFGGASVEFHEGQRDFNANAGVRYSF